MLFIGGDSKTLMVVQVAPVEKNISETVCSLNFAERVRAVELGQASKRIVDLNTDKFKDFEVSYVHAHSNFICRIIVSC